MTAGASTFSFTGTFTHDDDVQLFTLTLLTGTTLEARTLSYGGGVNAGSATIPAGGFDPALWIFDAGGPQLLVGSNQDGLCPPLQTDNGECFDSDLILPLPAGDYILALTQSGNFANGPTLADGFSATGSGDFTGGPFLDIFANQQDGHWALDILEADSAAELPLTSVPEPATFGAAGLGLFALAHYRRRRA
jgi:hypothetical protein